MLSLAQFQWRAVKTPLTFRWPSLDFLLNSDKIKFLICKFQKRKKIMLNGGTEKDDNPLG